MNSKWFFHLAFGTLFFWLSTGCSVHSIGEYAVSTHNVENARMRLGPRTGQFVAVGPFNSVQPGLSEIWCRINSPIRTPDGQPFADYIRAALVDELRLAGALAEDAAIRLGGRLDQIDFDSQEGKWNIVVTIRLSSGETFAVAESYPFQTSWYAERACDRTALAFVPAVQSLIGKIIRHEIQMADNR